MHIPDGYLSPIFAVSTGAVTVPAWAVASRRVRSVLDNRTIPLLAIFAAFCFTIMMFNIPVPLGTTAHAVGGTLLAIVLGPWAAILGVSTALIIQALFFGDGGILAIFANCLNMGIILPFVGYYSYRLIAGNSSVLSARRIWAAGIGSYLGITASALAVGIELGLQPLLFNDHGRALYSPYTLNQAIPAMLLTHMFGASLVEALVTAFGLAYLQKNHPQYLLSLRNALPGSEVVEGPRKSIWQPVAIVAVFSLIVFLVAGLVSGNGDPAHFFGADWTQVDWQAVGSMLLVVLGIAIILLPLARFLLPRRAKNIGMAFVTAAIISPLGLIAPGFAYGEGGTEDVHAAFGYVPQGLQNFSNFFSAPLSGYNLQFPFFSNANAPLWHAAIGYEISGIIGILLLGAVVFGLGFLLRNKNSTRDESAPQRTRTRNNISWLERTLGDMAGAIERAVFTEEIAHKDGWLQRIDPRAKLGMFLIIVLTASISNSFFVLAALYLLTLLAAYASRMPFDFFVRRVWIGIPFFAGIVILPSIFLTSGPRLFEFSLGAFTTGPSIPGLINAVIFVTRVGVCVSLAVLLILSSPWADVLKSLQSLRVPQIFILLLSMTYRYIFLLLHTANGLFEARKSRTVGRTGGAEQRRWISGSMGNLMNRSFKMSNDVYAAMAARGFSGTVRTYNTYRMKVGDWIALSGMGCIAFVALLAGGYIR